MKMIIMIDKIKPPIPPKTIIVGFEMIDEELADWLIGLDIVTREKIIFEAYIKYNLKKEENDA